MPRTTSFVCSGICLLLTTAATGQPPVLPKHPTLPQIVGHQLQQQYKWNLQQLPFNSVLFRNANGYQAHLAYLNSRNQRKLPPVNASYGFSLKQPYSLYSDHNAVLGEETSLSFLKLYLARERSQYNHWLRNRWWADPASNFGSGILRDIVAPGQPLPPPPGKR